MNALAPVIAQFEMQTRLFQNVTVDFTDADAGLRTNGANHVKWLTGHIVSSRFMMANVVGLNEPAPFPELFANAKGWQEGVDYPGMAELTKDWPRISGLLIAKLKHMSDTDLLPKAPIATPTDDGTLKGFFAFLAHHEAYTIGQIGYVRRLVGLEAMKYN